MRFIINKQCSLEEAVELARQPRAKVAIDIETVSLENQLPLGIGVAISPTVGFYFFNPDDELAHQMIESVDKVIAQNIAFDLPKLVEKGYKVKSYEDTMLIAYSAGLLEKSLSDLSQTILVRECPSVTSLWRKPKQGNIAIDHIKLGQICIIHACNTYALEEAIPKTSLYHTIDKPCIELVMEMERWGVLIDQFTLTKVEQSVINIVSPLEVELLAELGIDNLASNPQVAKALKDRGIIGTRKTRSAKDSVSEDSLKPLDLPVTNKILKWKSWMKTLTTYIPFMRTPDLGGRIHTHFGYTDTGRWLSRQPNLQNLTRDEKFTEGNI